MPIENGTTNLPSGITNVVGPNQTTLGSYVAPDPTRCHTWFDDFDDYVAAEWTITETGSGTRAVGNEDGGILVITNATSDNDKNALQWSGATNGSTVETFKWAATQSMWFKARLKLLEVTQTDLFIGLYTTNTDPVSGVVDGLYFSKTDGSASLVFNATKNSTSSSVTAATLTDATYFTCGFWWDSSLGVLTVYYNGNPVGVLTDTTNFPDDEEVTISFAVQNGQNAVASILSLDYFLVSKDRQATVTIA